MPKQHCAVWGSIVPMSFAFLYCFRFALNITGPLLQVVNCITCVATGAKSPRRWNARIQCCSKAAHKVNELYSNISQIKCSTRLFNLNIIYFSEILTLKTYWCATPACFRPTWRAAAPLLHSKLFPYTCWKWACVYHVTRQWHDGFLVA